MSRTLEEAKAIVEVAMKCGVSTWDNPAVVTDQDFIDRANELVDACVLADANSTTNEPVLEILRVAQIVPTSDVTREAYEQRFGAPASNGQSHDPAKLAAVVEAAHPEASAFGHPTTSPAQSEPLPEQASPVTAEPSAAGEQELHDRVNVIFGMEYNDLSATQIKAAIADSAASGDLLREEWEDVKAYETATEGRKTILSFEPEFKVFEPEPMIGVGTSDSAPVDESVWTGSGGAKDFVLAGGEGGTGTPPSLDDGTIEQVYSGEVPTRAQQEGLPIPQRVDFAQAPVVPIAIVDLSDKDLSALGAQLHSCFAYGMRLLSQEENRRDSAEHLEREAEHDAYTHAYALHREQIPEEKRTQPTALEAARKQAEKDAETNDKVRQWRNKRVRHAADARELKALVEVWNKGVWRVDKELDRRARAATTARAAQ